MGRVGNINEWRDIWSNRKRQTYRDLQTMVVMMVMMITTVVVAVVMPLMKIIIT